MTTVLSIVVLVVFLAAGLALWWLARRTESQTDFEQSKGVSKSDDGLRLGIALSSTTSFPGGS